MQIIEAEPDYQRNQGRKIKSSSARIHPPCSIALLFHAAYKTTIAYASATTSGSVLGNLAILKILSILRLRSGW